MGEHTGIAWCHHTLNPWIGCTKVDTLCKNCYAEVWGVLMHDPKDATRSGARPVPS